MASNKLFHQNIGKLEILKEEYQKLILQYVIYIL